jgi:hypothetical protein
MYLEAFLKSEPNSNVYTLSGCYDLRLHYMDVIVGNVRNKLSPNLGVRGKMQRTEATFLAVTYKNISIRAHAGKCAVF